jgi:dihydrofolate reductase
VSELILVAAVAANGVIGRDGGLVFRHPADAKHFRDTTMGAPVIMGRKTWESLPERFRPLPGRHNIVVSRQPSYRANGADVTTGLEAALALAAGAPRVFVIGGAELYAQALPRATGLVITEVQADFQGDVLFPPWPRARFSEVARQRGSAPGETPAFDFVRYTARG